MTDQVAWTTRQLQGKTKSNDKLCVWRPPSDTKKLESRGFYVTYLEGSFSWLGKALLAIRQTQEKNHWLGKICYNYGHNAVQLECGPHKVKNLLNVPGFVSAYKKQRASLRLMSWCTYSVPDNLRQTLYWLSTLCARHTTTPALLLAWRIPVRNGASRCAQVL